MCTAIAILYPLCVHNNTLSAYLCNNGTLALCTSITPHFMLLRCPLINAGQHLCFLLETWQPLQNTRSVSPITLFLITLFLHPSYTGSASPITLFLTTLFLHSSYTCSASPITLFLILITLFLHLLCQPNNTLLITLFLHLLPAQ